MKTNTNCHICDSQITEKTKYATWEFEGKKQKICLKCDRKLQNKLHKEKFDTFFQGDNDYPDDPIGVDRYISQKTKMEVWQRDRGRCAKCGSNIKIEFDHIIPVSKGGSSTARNIQLLCEPCNRRKSSKIQ